MSQRELHQAYSSRLSRSLCPLTLFSLGSSSIEGRRLPTRGLPMASSFLQYVGFFLIYRDLSSSIAKSSQHVATKETNPRSNGENASLERAPT